MSLIARLNTLITTIKLAFRGLDNRIVALENASTDNSLSVPNLLDESNAIYFYFGWENVNGGWLVIRQNRSTSITESATTGHANLTDAFADRINLGYS